jgi:hypothetical protein
MTPQPDRTEPPKLSKVKGKGKLTIAWLPLGRLAAPDPPETLPLLTSMTVC